MGFKPNMGPGSAAGRAAINRKVVELCADFVAETVVPLHPLLRVKAKYLNDKVLKERLLAMSEPANLVPNTRDWNEHFETEGPLLTKTPINGRRLLLDDEPLINTGPNGPAQPGEEP